MTAPYLSCVTDKAALGVTFPQRYHMPILQCFLDVNENLAGGAL